MTKPTEYHKKPQSKRVREYNESLESALARPGVREVMKVYGGWQEIGKGMDAYRIAAHWTGSVVTSNKSNGF